MMSPDSPVISKLWHTLSGLYLWEFFTTLDYEWSVIRGRRPYRWTIWIYSLARVAALVGVILGFVMMDVMKPIDCQVVISFVIVFSFLSMAASSLLVVLRVIAIWAKHKVAVAMAVGVWAINSAFFIQGAARLRATWIPAERTCVPINMESNVLNLVAMLVTDIALLLIMFAGLIRLRRQGGFKFGLIQLLWRQGIVWLLIATAAEIPPVVFVILNLTAPITFMFQPPSWITMAIAATRMHRSLVDYASRYTDVAHEKLQVPGTKRIDATSSYIDRMEAAMHMVSEPYGTSQMMSDDLCISTSEATWDKPNTLSRDDNMEGGV